MKEDDKMKSACTKVFRFFGKHLMVVVQKSSGRQNVLRDVIFFSSGKLEKDVFQYLLSK